tara:strand:- start:7 stop:435 length:429 start_codon:yes stop_codon:yes gene_type:complete
MLSFKDMTPVEYRPGEDELTNYRAYRRKRLSEDTTTEALDLMQRLQRARLIKRIKTKIKVGKERAKRKVADVKKLRVRARKAARNLLAKRLTSGVPKGELNAKRKQDIEKRLEKMGPAIDRIAKKMFPIVRKKEIEKKRVRK